MTKFTIDYCKTKPIDLKHLEISFLPNSEEKDYQYNPFLIQGLQKYQPIYSLFFEMTENNYSTINLKHRFHMIDMNTVFDISSNQSIQKPVFIKYSPLYDPIKYMIGKYTNNNYEPLFYNARAAEEYLQRLGVLRTDKRGRGNTGYTNPRYYNNNNSTRKRKLPTKK